MNSRQHKKQQTRQAFFNATLDLSMKGLCFSAISLRQLTNEVGVVPNTFYRHFDNMEDLGKCLVKEEINPLLFYLRDRYQVKRHKDYEQQIIQCVHIFLAAIDTQPRHFRFLVSERFGGSQAVRQAIDFELKLFMQMLSEDLSLQASLQRVSAYDRRLLAEVVLNLNLSWVLDWVALNYSRQLTETGNDALWQAKMQRMRDNFTRQALMIMLGAENWHSDEEIRLDA